MPFLLVCAGIGVVLSVVVRRAEIAQRVAAGFVFFLWLFATITANVEDVDWLGVVSPTHYYDPTAILVHGTYDLVDAGLLLVASVALVTASILYFERRDI